MAHTNVSSCVLSIVASFASGLDVFKKFKELRDKRKRRSKKNASLDSDEVKLARSLRQGPEDIGREYQRSISAVGEHFAQGDVIAQTSLAEVLLKLNTGLVTVINAFLSRDKQNSKLDYQSLTSLSERSRIDTCRALRQLYRRMLQQVRLPRQLSSYENESVAQEQRIRSNVSETRKRSRKPAANPRYTKIRGPMLARVVVAGSDKPGQIAMVRPGERKKKRHPSSGPSSKAQSNISLAAPAPLPSPHYSAEPPEARPQYSRSKTQLEIPRPQRKPSATDIASVQAPRPDALRATRSTPRLETIAQVQHESLPPITIPRTAPLPAIPTMEPRRRNNPTPTYYSIASNSTKLGEIPLHKWSETVDFDAMSLVNRQAAQNGWPITDLDTAQQKKKRGGIFRLFRKNRAES